MIISRFLSLPSVAYEQTLDYSNGMAITIQNQADKK